MQLSALGAIERIPSQPHIPRCPSRHRFNTYAVGILRQLRAIKRSAVELKRLLLKAYGPEIERNTYARTHAGLRSIATFVIERTPNLAAHLIFSVNRTLCDFIWFYVWGGASRASNPLFFTV